MKTTKFVAGIAAATALALSLSACGGTRGGGAAAGSGETPDAEANKGALIGVAMPTKTSERWIDDGNNVKAKLEALGYKVDLQYANDKVPDQQQQIESMLNNGAKALIIASIDGTALTRSWPTPAQDGVKVIAYDRLINGSPNVDYYVTFDNEKVGDPAGHLAADRPRRPGRRRQGHRREGPVQRRALRRQPGRQQRARSSSTAR